MRIVNSLLTITAVQALLLGLIGLAQAQDKAAFDRETPVVRVYQKAHKAVVNVAGERLASTSIWQGFDWPDMFDRWGPRVRTQVTVLAPAWLCTKTATSSPMRGVIKARENQDNLQRWS